MTMVLRVVAEALDILDQQCSTEEAMAERDKDQMQEWAKAQLHESLEKPAESFIQAAAVLPQAEVWAVKAAAEIAEVLESPIQAAALAAPQARIKMVAVGS